MPRAALDTYETGTWSPDGCGRQSDGGPWEGGFPRYVWYENDGTVFEGRLVNRGNGAYKGYPLYADEWPAGIQDLYAGP